MTFWPMTLLRYAWPTPISPVRIGSDDHQPDEQVEQDEVALGDRVVDEQLEQDRVDQADEARGEDRDEDDHDLEPVGLEEGGDPPERPAAPLLRDRREVLSTGRPTCPPPPIIRPPRPPPAAAAGHPARRLARLPARKLILRHPARGGRSLDPSRPTLPRDGRRRTTFGFRWSEGPSTLDGRPRVTCRAGMHDFMLRLRLRVHIHVRMHRPEIDLGWITSDASEVRGRSAFGPPARRRIALADPAQCRNDLRQSRPADPSQLPGLEARDDRLGRRSDTSSSVALGHPEPVDVAAGTAGR